MNRKAKIASLAAIAAALGVTAAVAAPGGMRHPLADMTRAQASAKAGEHFDRMDANKDGKLDAADRSARQAQMFDRLDTDRNGSISRAEFDAHRAGPGGRGGPDGDRPMGRHMGGPGGRHGGPDGDMGGMMLRADANGDHALTKAEFVNAALARFDAADTNKDGTVSVAEHQAARQAMKARWQQMRQQPQAQPTGN